MGWTGERAILIVASGPRLGLVRAWPASHSHRQFRASWPWPPDQLFGRPCTCDRDSGKHMTAADHMPSSHHRYADWTIGRIRRGAAALIGSATAALCDLRTSGSRRDARHRGEGARTHRLARLADLLPFRLCVNAPTGRQAAQYFCYDGFGHDAPLHRCVLASPGPEFRISGSRRRQWGPPRSSPRRRSTPA